MISFLLDGWLSHREKWQEVLADSFLIYHRSPEFVRVFWRGRGGLLVASHSLLRQSIITGVGWFSCPFSLQSNAGC